MIENQLTEILVEAQMVVEYKWQQNVTRRDVDYHMNKEGFGPARLDKSSANKDATCGREQQLIY
jgi:hypothetical protein